MLACARHSLTVAALVLLVAIPCRAQVSRITNETATPVPGAGHDYIKFLSETVNPANGSVSVRIQIPTPKGRVLTIPFSFEYDSNTVHHLDVRPLSQSADGLAYVMFIPYWRSNYGFMAQGGWTYSLPSLRFDQYDGSDPSLFVFSTSWSK